MDDSPNKPTPKAKKTTSKARCQALTTFKTWDDSSSDDEAQHASLHGSSHICLMSKGKYECESESDVSSDDNLPSYDDLTELLENFQKNMH